MVDLGKSDNPVYRVENGVPSPVQFEKNGASIAE